MAKKKNQTPNPIAKRQLLLMRAIITLLDTTHMKGYQLITVLAGVMADVMYNSSDDHSDKTIEETCESIKNLILDAVHKIYKTADDIVEKAVKENGK